MVRFTLSREERLSSLKEISALFEEGKSLTQYPLRLIWRKTGLQEAIPAKILFSVSKKKFPRAVDRNRIKRLMRESYRLLKPGFFEKLPNQSTFHLGLIYTGQEISELTTIQKSLAKSLDKLITQISKD